MAEHVTILVVAGPHSLSGELENRSVRVQDFLNDSATEFLHLCNVTVHRGFLEGNIEAFKKAAIPKASIDFVVLEQAKHEAPMRRQHSLVDKRLYSAFILVGNYEINGTLMLKGAPDVVGALSRELSAFFPVMNPLVSTSSGEKHSVPVGLTLINKGKITLLHLDQHVVRPDES